MTYTKTQATQIAQQFGRKVANFRSNAKVTIEQDWMPDGSMFFKFRAAGGRYAGSVVGVAY